MIKEWHRLRKNIRSFRPHVLHAHYGTVTALFSGLSASAPLVVTYRGSDLNPDPSASWLAWLARTLISQFAALRATEIICVSEQLRQRLWWRRHRVAVIPTGVDTSIFYPRPRSEARAQLGWRDDERVVLFNAGGHPKIKRLDLAHAGLEVARNFCGNVRFAVLNGDIAPETVPLMMCAADCLLVTSDWEGSPTVVQEAIGCNLPVVAVDVGDVRSRLAGVWPSSIVDRNPEHIGKALAEILIQRRRSNGTDRVRDISNGAIVERIITIYHAALQKNRATETHSSI